jgi:hypothetical protein
MIERRKLLIRFALGLGAVVVLIPVGFIVYLWLYSYATYVPSKIVDFQLSDFQAKANAYFFYSIGDELKYFNELSPQTPTLMRGQITNFLVSPDNTMIAVVANGSLMVVGPNEPVVRKVTPVDSIYRDLIHKEGIPLGKQFFRDDDFQWSRDSRHLYLIRDEFYDSKGSQLYSSKGELWRYTLEDGTLQLVLKPFPAFNYFFGVQSGIYFSVPTERGDLQLKYFDGHSTIDIGRPNAPIPVNALSSLFVESPFFSFSSTDYERTLGSKGVDLAVDGASGPQELKIRTRRLLSFTQGNGFKGHFYCSSMSRDAFLPGDRYLLFNVYCQNYEGQLLIDTLTGSYERLPKDSRIYLRFNTDNMSYYRITGEGIAP